MSVVQVGMPLSFRSGVTMFTVQCKLHRTNYFPRFSTMARNGCVLKFNVYWPTDSI